MYAYFLQYFFRNLINWEQKGNFNVQFSDMHCERYRHVGLCIVLN